MKEPTMPVRIFMDGEEVYKGEMLQNGSGLALCSQMNELNLLHYAADTEAVEAKIPMQICMDNQVLDGGEFYQSGDYYCISTPDSTMQLMDPGSLAELYIEDHCQKAKLEITRGH
jgi:hypothetical protein